MSASFRETLIAGASAIGIEVSSALADAMTAHYALVVKWAARMNLTTVTDPASAASIHGIDSLLFLEHLVDRPGASAVDIGSGAGFPGLVLALARPDLKMTLVEPKRKRASFLRVALAELRRPDVAVVEAKLEDPITAFPTELLLSRATIPPLPLIERSPEKLRAGGRLIITSGSGAPPLPAIVAACEGVGLHHRRRVERALPSGETRIFDVIERSA